MDSADYDATNEEEDPLNPADIEGDANNDDDPASEAGPQDPISLPNNDFCFTEDDFLELVEGSRYSSTSGRVTKMGCCV